MKIEGLPKKISHLHYMSLPCSSEEYSELRDGNVIEVEEDVANKLLSMGLVKKISPKKSKSKGEK